MEDFAGFKLTFSVKDGKLDGRTGTKSGARHKVTENKSKAIVERLEKSVVKKAVLPKDKTKDGPMAQFIADPLENYIPRARVFYIATHVCPECGDRSSYTAADLLEYSRPENVAGKNTIRTRAFAASDYRWNNLPRRVERLGEESRICPVCLAVAEQMDAGQLQVELQFPLALDLPTPEQPAVSKPVLWTHRESVAEFKKKRRELIAELAKQGENDESED